MSIRTAFRLSIILAAAVFLASCGNARAHADKTTDVTDQQIVSLEDRTFLLNAEAAEIRQIAFCELAMDKAGNQDIHDFAGKVISSHRGALARLQDLMKSKNLRRSPAEADAIRRDATNRLDRLSGAAFDGEFLSLMAADQQESLRRFNSASETAVDSDIRNYARTVLPAMREEFDAVTALQRKLVPISAGAAYEGVKELE